MMKSNAKIIRVFCLIWVKIPWWHQSSVYYREQRKHKQLSLMLKKWNSGAAWVCAQICLFNMSECLDCWLFGLYDPWWRHQMETFSLVTGPLCREFTGHRWIPPHRPVTRSFDFSLICSLNKRLSKQSWGWWFETSTRLLWCHWNARSVSRVFDKRTLWRCGKMLVNQTYVQWATLVVEV